MVAELPETRFDPARSNAAQGTGGSPLITLTQHLCQQAISKNVFDGRRNPARGQRSYSVDDGGSGLF